MADFGQAQASKPDYDWFRQCWEILSPSDDRCNIRQIHRHEADCLFVDTKIGTCRGRRGTNEIVQSSEDGLYVTLYSEGGLRFTSKGTEAVMRAGDILLWDTGMEGSFDCPDGADGRTILFPRKMVERRLGRIDRLYGMQPDPRDARTSLLRGHFQTLHNLAGRTNENIMRALLESSLELTFLCSVQEDEVSLDSGTRSAFEMIRRDISEHIASADLSPLAASQRLGMGVRRLQNVLSAHGKTFTGMVAEERILRASQMLRSPAFKNQSICEIGLSLGFYDHAHFSNTFKRFKKMTPREYRSQN